MSMYRQLLLAISLSTLLALIGSLFASMMSSRAYLNEQLRTKNSDNATVLALSLSQKNIDPIELELVVASLFDNGHYQSIRVHNPAGKLLVERVAPLDNHTVPSWFTKLLPISSPPGKAQISNGWKQIGTISIISRTGNAYETLWRSTREMIAALFLSGLLAAYLGSLVIHRLRKPLREVIDQAKGMVERRFVTVNESTVPELKQLNIAMNSTATLLKSMFAQEAERIEELRKQASTDAATGLTNRSTFLSQLQATVEEENAPAGSLIILRILGLADANRHLGRNKTDAMLKQIGNAFLKIQESLLDGTSARLNGTDFALLCRQIPIDDITQRLLQDVSMHITDAASVVSIHIGYGYFEFGISPGILLSEIDGAVASAETLGPNTICKAAPLDIEHAPKSLEEWSQLIQRAISQNWVKLDYFKVVNHAGETQHKESALRLMFGGEWFPAGRFLPIAERLGQTSNLDLIAVKLAFEELLRTACAVPISVNISASSILDNAFRDRLRLLIKSKPELSRHLWMEISERGVFHHLDAFRTFHKAMTQCGCKVGLEHFGKQFDQIGLLHDLKLDFAKIDVAFIRHIETNEANLSFVKGASNILRNMNLMVFAEGVSSSDEIDALKDCKLDGFTGPAVGRIFAT